MNADAPQMTVFPVTFDAGTPLVQLIAAGTYDSTHDDITGENFPEMANGVITLGLILVHLNRDVSTEDMEREIARLDLKPATIRDLLAFGAMYQDIQRAHPVVALGSSFVGGMNGRGVACLDEDSGKRRLSVGWTDFGWPAVCRFLAVRKAR